MKEKKVKTLLNLIKVKSLVTFATVFILIYEVINDKFSDETVFTLIVLVFESLFKKSKEGE